MRPVHRYEVVSTRSTHDHSVDVAVQINAGLSFPAIMPEDIQRLATLPDGRRMKRIARYESHLSRLLARVLQQLDAIRSSSRQDLLVVAALIENADPNPTAKLVRSEVLPAGGAKRA
jgi:hypothetical protein